MNFVNVLVAEFQELIKPAIPQIFFAHRQLNDHSVSVDALSKFSDQGKVLKIFV